MIENCQKISHFEFKKCKSYFWRENSNIFVFLKDEYWLFSHETFLCDFQTLWNVGYVTKSILYTKQTDIQVYISKFQENVITTVF